MKNVRLLQLFMVIVLLLVFDCRKKEDIPEKPTNLTATVITDNEIDLAWSDNSSNEAGFKLERSQNGGSDWIVVTSTAADVSSYKNTGLSEGSSYSYRVLAFNSAGNSGYSNLASGSTPVAIVYSLAILTTNVVSSYTQTTAEAGGNITSDGNSPVLARGVCWNTAASPTVSNNKTTDGGGTGSFSSSITGLSAGTQYYVRAYATNSVGTSYGEQVTFTTLPPLPVTATLTTTEVTSFTSYSAVGGGNVTASGGADITVRGVCWGTAENPTIENDTTINGTGTGSFTSNINGLTGNTKYYVRAYAINSAGISYGEQVSFTTSATSAFVPVVTTAAGSSVTATTAVSGGNITSDKGQAVTVRGVCWSTATGPTIADDTTKNGSGSGSFSSSIDGLTPNTKYYIRAYAINNQGVGYGDEVTINTTNVVPPSATSSDASSISATSATLNGSVNANGTSTTITFEYGTTFMYGSSISATPSTSAGITPETVTAVITGLTANTDYHFRIKAVSAGGTVYGEDKIFKTLVLPSATTLKAEYIFPTSATLTGYVNANGNATSIKFEYGQTTSYGTILLGIPDNANGSTDVPSRVDLTGLTKSTTYHFRIVAENRAGTTYGDDKTFTTPENDPVIPVLTTAPVTEITFATATGGGNITSNGGGEVTARGICFSTDPSPTLDDSKTINGTGTGEFTSPFTGLSPNTQYYVRAYATNFVGTAYGNEVSFTSDPPPAELPTVSTTAISDITHEAAKSGGEVTNDGGGTITAKGICWSTSENPTISDSKTDEGTGTGVYTSNLTGLSASTLYYVRAYATNSAGTAYGSQEIFVTDDPPAGLATLTTTAGSDITNSSALSGGNITSDGGGGITERGVCWSTAPGPTIAGSKTSDGTGTGIFASNITGLSPSTMYYVRAFATNEAGTAYGNQITITTLDPDPVLPSVTTSSITSKTHNSASGGGNVTSEGYATVTERGICWSTSANPTTSDSKLNSGTGSGTYTISITGLSPSTTYHVRAYAINSVGTAYGDDVSFTTDPPPYTLATVSTTSATSVTSSTASTGGNVTSDGGASVTAKGVCYSTSSGPTLSDNYTTNGTETGSFTSNLTDLSASTMYYVRAYATNAAGTAYGNEISFSTPVEAGAPQLTTTSASSITTTTATSGGNITDDGDGAGPHTITAKGVCWSTTINPTTSNSKTSDGTGTGSYSSSLTGLTPCTTYHIRAYATNSAGFTAYGADKTFTTGSVLPGVSTTTLTSPTSTSVSTGGTVSGDCSSTVTERGVVYGTSTNPTTSGSKIISGSGSGSYTISITGLTPCTTYFIRAYAINASGTQYGNERSFTTNTVKASISNPTINSSTSTTASVSATVSGDCTTGVTRGICYATTSNPTTANSTVASGTTGAGTYTVSLTGLTPCTTYYVRGYVTNSAGTAYSSTQGSFTTGVSSPTIVTTTVSAITSTTASSGGTISGNCAGSVTSRGVCWNTTGSPTTANSKTTNGSGSGAFTSSITGLTRLTTYYVRAYVVIGASTYYGNQVSFSTIADIPTVSTSTISTTITNTSTTGGGNVTSDGGATVTARGVCWSTSSNPTTANSYSSDGTGTGSYTSSITGLSAGTTYYVRAYATNSSGTAYGVNRSFTTPAQVTDYDNNTYSTISYSGNVWMQSNLRVTHYKNGDAMWQASDTSQYGGYAYYHSYNDNSSYASYYGYMYGGYAVNANICPTGWHVPTQSEWKTLGDYIGGGYNYYQYAADKMKQNSSFYRSGMSWVLVYFWNSGMTGDNSGLFYGRGGGYYDGGDSGLKESTRWWTGTSLRYIRIDKADDMLYGAASTLQGYSDQAYYIRCKKD